MKYIYILYNSGVPKYVGQTSNLNERIGWHKSTKKDWNISFEVLEVCQDDLGSFWEQHYMSLYKSWGFDISNIYLGKKKLKKGSADLKKNLSRSCSDAWKDDVKRFFFEVGMMKRSLTKKLPKETEGQQGKWNNGFKKGYIPSNKGKKGLWKPTEEQKEKMRLKAHLRELKIKTEHSHEKRI